MIRCFGLSIQQRRAIQGVGAVMVAATNATGAFAQSTTQTLTLTFPAAAGPMGLPISGWTAVAITVMLALVGGLMLRRRSPTGARLWSAGLLATGALLALQSTDSAKAIIPQTPLNLVSSPASVQFTFPGAPPETDVVVTNKTGGKTTILSITLSPGPYVVLGNPGQCTVGMVLPNLGTCNIDLGAV